MKTLRLLIWTVTLITAITLDARAQDQSFQVAQAKSDLLAKGVNISGSCGAVKITNLVAWRLRPAYGLLFKQGGNRAALQPDGSCLSGDETTAGGYATDYLIQRNLWDGYDLLSDGGGLNGPQWSGPENDPATQARNIQNFREPLDPRGYYVDGQIIPPVITPPVITPPVPLPSIDLLQQCVALITKVDANVTAGREENRQFQEHLKTFWQQVLPALKFVLPALGAYIAGKTM